MQLAVGVLHRDGVVVGVEPHQRLANSAVPSAIRRASNGCLGRGRKAAWSSTQQLALGRRLAARPLGQIGQAPLAELLVQRRQRVDLRHRHQEVPPGEPNSRSTCPFSLARRTRQKCSWNR